MLQAVIFDMDGVLIDSAPSVDKARIKHFALRGIDLSKIPDPHGEGHKGNSLSSIMRIVKKLHPDVTIDEEAFSKDFVADAYKDLLELNISVDSDLVTLLDELQARHVPCAITSSGKHASVSVKLDILGIRDYFKVIVAAEDAKNHKPHPELYIRTIDMLGVDPANCIVFEDSVAGVTAGNAAGCKVIGFTKFAGPKQALKGTVKSIDDWARIDYPSLVKLAIAQA